MRHLATAIILAGLLVTGTGATEVRTYTITAPQVWGAYDIDFGAAFTNIVGVEISATGIGGVQNGYCEYISGHVDLALPLDLIVELDTHVLATGWLDLPALEAFDATGDMQLAEGQPDWSFLTDGHTTVRLDVEDSYEFDMHWCYPTGFVLPEIAELTFRVTAESVVPTDAETWSTVKALYR
jgi:hypothetical protein